MLQEALLVVHRHRAEPVMMQNSGERRIELLYLETMPLLATFYLQALTLTVGSIRRGKHALRYTPPESHSRPTLFEARLTLPTAVRLELYHGCRERVLEKH